MEHKKCYGKCERCVWLYNGGCSEWRKIALSYEYSTKDVAIEAWNRRVNDENK